MSEETGDEVMGDEVRDAMERAASERDEALRDLCSLEYGVGLMAGALRMAARYMGEEFSKDAETIESGVLFDLSRIEGMTWSGDTREFGRRHTDLPADGQPIPESEGMVPVSGKMAAERIREWVNKARDDRADFKDLLALADRLEGAGADA